MRGPFPAGAMHDGTLFRGGKKEEKMEDRDKASLYFKTPLGKKAIGDSGYEGIPEKATCTDMANQRWTETVLGPSEE